MLRLYSIIIFLWIMHQFAMGAESTVEENKSYYKPTDTIIKNQKDLKNIIPIVIEGQPPLSELSSTRKVTATRKITDKLNKTVPHSGVSIKSNENFYNSSERSIVTNLNTTQNVSQQHPDTNLTVSSNSIKNSTRFHVAPVNEITQEVNSTPSSTPATTKRTKPKPIVTIGEKEADEPIPASPTNKSPFGIPRKIDYIVPGVITVTVLPLLAVVFYVLYKRGRDYWDKRHYRRMDFLIDGMYNE